MKPHTVTPEEREKNENAKFLYFDFETYIQDDGQLVPNLAVVQDDTGTQWTFPSTDEPLEKCITDPLCEFLISEHHKGHYIIAHNFKAFDGYFILQWLLKNGVTPKVIMNGGKILQLHVPGYDIHFRDSINYNPQSLAKWPATFGLPDISKGTFPHKFNRRENWDRVAPYPSMDEYGFRTMDKKAQASFKEWYDADVKAKSGLFDFRKEFVAYCENDVTVLRTCCQQFRKLFMEISNGLCPFTSALTIAGLCNLYWRSFILKANQIGLVPQQRFARNRLQSVKAMKWISWMENEENCVIQSVVSGTEQKIGPYYVDGYQEDTGHIYEFYGCWYHGCPTCMDPETVHPFRNLPMRDIYKETMDREQYLRSLGHPVTTVWEHDFDADLRIDSEMRKFINDIKITEPLNPRNAFYGGRTNAVRLLHTVAADEKIKYFDVNSEYPFVNKNRRYPLGHPIILTKSFQNVREYFGLVHCTVLPPADLWLPILPYRCNGKLTFPLCATCVKEQNSKKCDHTDSERN
ncbi:uncharacterized protein LOC129598480 [Paramacrobiotus metropolitanus]|uniref:uncharacterized protein LOC129598480 n=1 Tax=Paramacrobiotus metropolitanus TaxID=2943436 RepID=UPI002445A882|nr:uncharacterized protein LOC129598480 [Paramacrobiotus metropolitanus]